MIHKDYTINELVNNPSFRSTVNGTASAEQIQQWDNWIEQSNQNRKKAKQAISEIVGFEFKDPALPDINAEWKSLKRRTVGKPYNLPNKSKRKGSKLKRIYLSAAVVLLAAMGSVWIYNFSNSISSNKLEQVTEARTISTVDGEQKTLRFTNNSKIIMNSNSTLTYSIGLNEDRTIYVTLDGEAFFDADSGTKKNPVFAVTTPDGTIKDIGTQFLVSVQNERSRVVLQDGYVEVEYTNSDWKDQQKKTFNVKKGELVEFSRTSILKKELVNASFYTSWATDYLEFDQTKIGDFTKYMEQYFGVEVQIVDPKIADITLDGAVYFKSLGDLVRSVSDVTGITAYQSDDGKSVFIDK